MVLSKDYLKAYTSTMRLISSKILYVSSNLVVYLLNPLQSQNKIYSN